MGNIKLKHVIAAFLCIVFFVIFLFMGFGNWLLFIPAVCAIIGYVVIDKRYLRCPHCGHFINLDFLFYARTHIYHCKHCGKIVKVDW